MTLACGQHNYHNNLLLYVYWVYMYLFIFLFTVCISLLILIIIAINIIIIITIHCIYHSPGMLLMKENILPVYRYIKLLTHEDTCTITSQMYTVYMYM